MEPGEIYLNAVRKQLRGPRRERECFLAGLREDIECFSEQNPDASCADMEASFGSPKDLAQEFASSLEPQVMECFLRMRKRFFVSVGAIVIVAALIITCLLVVNYIKLRGLANGYYIETIILPEESVDLPEKPNESTDTIRVYK